MKDKASADTLNTFTYQKFRLVMALYWGVLGYLLILLVMGFGANSIYPERAFIDLLNLKQLGAFAFPCLVGYFALPRFIDHNRGAKRRAFLGGTLCFALAIFVVNTLFMMTRIYESAQVLGLTPAILSKAYFYITGALISAAIVSPLGGIFALIAQITFPHPNKIQLSTQRLERALNKGTGREPPDRPETKETFNKVFRSAIAGFLTKGINQPLGDEPTFLYKLIMGGAWAVAVYLLFEYAPLLQTEGSSRNPWKFANVVFDYKAHAAIIFGAIGFFVIPNFLTGRSYEPEFAIAGIIRFTLTLMVKALIPMIIVGGIALYAAFPLSMYIAMAVLFSLPVVLMIIGSVLLVISLTSCLVYSCLFFSPFNHLFWKPA